MSDAFDRVKQALAGRYAIERELGSGGMATVYLAEDLKHHRKLAVKVLRPDLTATLGSERFLREIEIAAQLHHPHILPLYDSGEAEGLLYYVMPYEEGQSLRDKLAKEGELPVNEAVRLLRDVVDALAHAHEHGVVHRDIKPENILLSGHHALVTDFGVAKAVSEATGRDKLTTAGVALGTPAYMAPEQAAADPHIDHRADIYAVGALAYELLAGRPPFLGPTPQMVLSAHVTETPEPVTRYRAAVAAPLAELVMKCLEKKPADRWQSAEELLPRIEALTTPSGGVTPTDTQPVAGVRRVGRNRIAMAIVAVAVLAVVAVGTLLLPKRGVALAPRRVVVGLLENRTGDPALDGLGSMATDWITQGLKRTGIVDVIPSPTALQSSRHVAAEIEAGRVSDPVKALAEETGAGIVISAAYYQQGGTLQFHLQVTDAARGALIGTPDPVSGPVELPREIIGRLSERVMGFLAVSFDERLAAPAALASRPPTFEAYQAFNDGMERYIRMENRAALPHFRRAFELDSTFFKALLFAGINHVNLGQWAQLDSLTSLLDSVRDRLVPYDRQWLEYLHGRLEGDHNRGLRAMRRAAEMAPGSKALYNLALMAEYTNRPPEVLEALGKLDPERGPMRRWWNYWRRVVRAHHVLGDHTRALREAQRARRQYPEVPRMLDLELGALAALGRVDEVNQRLKESYSFQPSAAWAAWSPALTMYLAGIEARAHGYRDEAGALMDSAAVWCRGRLREEPESELYRRQLADALYAAERWEEAREVVEGLAAESPDDVGYQGRLGSLAARLGDRAEALRVSDWLETVEQPYLRGSNTRWRARIAAVLGQRDLAVSLLQSALLEGGAFFEVHRDVDFESLRDYPPFQELMRPKE